MRMPPIYKVDWEDAKTDWVDGVPDLKPEPRCSVGFLLGNDKASVQLADCVDRSVVKEKKIMGFIQCIPRKMITKMRRIH